MTVRKTVLGVVSRKRSFDIIFNLPAPLSVRMLTIYCTVIHDRHFADVFGDNHRAIGDQDPHFRVGKVARQFKIAARLRPSTAS